MVPGTTTGEQTERLIAALTANADSNTERIIAALEQWHPPVVTAREVVREVRIEPPESSPVAPVAFPVANATDVQQPPDTYINTVNIAKKPREYILEYLEANAEVLARLSEDNTFGYRELAAEISVCYDINFDHTTVYRTVRKYLRLEGK